MSWVGPGTESETYPKPQLSIYEYFILYCLRTFGSIFQPLIDNCLQAYYTVYVPYKSSGKLCLRSSLVRYVLGTWCSGGLPYSCYSVPFKRVTGIFVCLPEQKSKYLNFENTNKRSTFGKSSSSWTSASESTFIYQNLLNFFVCKRGIKKIVVET